MTKPKIKHADNNISKVVDDGGQELYTGSPLECEKVLEALSNIEPSTSGNIKDTIKAALVSYSVELSFKRMWRVEPRPIYDYQNEMVVQQYVIQHKSRTWSWISRWKNLMVGVHGLEALSELVFDDEGIAMVYLENMLVKAECGDL